MSKLMYFCYMFILSTFLVDKTISAEDNGDDFGAMSHGRENSLLRTKERFDMEEEFSKRLTREKRQLIFPVQTLLQLSFCYVSPTNLTGRAIFVNQGFQLNFLLPNTTSKVPNTFFWMPPVINARSIEKREILYPSSLPNADFNDLLRVFNGITTEQLYVFIENTLNDQGYDGTECLLHAICHLTSIPLHQDNDLLHEIVQFILTPSLHDIESNEYNITNTKNSRYIGGYSTLHNPTPIQEYLQAEKVGASNENCDEVYTKCPSSPLHRLTEIMFDDD